MPEQKSITKRWSEPIEFSVGDEDTNKHTLGGKFMRDFFDEEEAKENKKES